MSYSRSMKQRQDRYMKRIIITWIICFFIGLIIGAIIGIVVTRKIYEPKIFIQEVKEPELYETRNYEIPEIAEPTLLGEYRITAYCSCEKCCGSWENDRPDGIVYGASGNELVPGVSAASPLPFGTEVYIAGYGNVVIQDRTADWIKELYDGKIIDIYFSNHDEASAFGLRYANVYKFESEE